MFYRQLSNSSNAIMIIIRRTQRNNWSECITHALTNTNARHGITNADVAASVLIVRNCETFLYHFKPNENHFGNFHRNFITMPGIECLYFDDNYAEFYDGTRYMRPGTVLSRKLFIGCIIEAQVVLFTCHSLHFTNNPSIN